MEWQIELPTDMKTLLEAMRLEEQPETEEDIAFSADDTEPDDDFSEEEDEYDAEDEVMDEEDVE